MDRVDPSRRGVHHHRGPADVSAARRGPRPDRRMRQAISRRPDDVRSAAGRSSPRGSAAARGSSLRYRVPPMPFTLSPSEFANLANTVPGIRAVHDLPMVPGRGKVINGLMWTSAAGSAARSRAAGRHAARVRLAPNAASTYLSASPLSMPSAFAAVA